MRYRDNAVFNGEWSQGNRHGKGIMHYRNGDVYEGEWQDDKRHGYGTLKIGNKYDSCSKDTKTYEGEW